MCCKRLAANTGRKKTPKIRHLRTIAQLCRAISSQLRHASTIGNKLLLNMFSQHDELRPTNGRDRLASFGHPMQQISTGFASWLRYCTDVAQRRSTKLCTMFGHLLGWYILHIHFGGSCPLTEICQVQNSFCVQVLRYPALAGVTVYGTRAVIIRQTLRRGIFTRQGGHPVRHWAVELSSFIS